MALADLLKLSSMDKNKAKETMGFRLIEGFLSDENGNGILTELKEKVGQDKIISAYKDFSVFADNNKQYFDKNTEEYKALLNIFIECMYEVLPTYYDSLYRSVIIQMFMNKLSFIAFKDYANSQEMYQKFMMEFVELINNHEEVAQFIIGKMFDTVGDFIDRKHPVDANYSEEDIKRIDEMNKPIKIEKFSESLRLYHGTSLENYKDILKDGYIRRSDYKNLDYSLVKESEKIYRTKYKHEDKFVFLDSGMDIPILFCSGGYRKNILYWSREMSEEEKERKGEEDRLNAEGVIFIVNPKNYNVYFYPTENQFLIDEDIRVEDTEVIFVHYNGGIITITDEEGNEINDILY